MMVAIIHETGVDYLFPNVAFYLLKVTKGEKGFVRHENLFPKTMKSRECFKIINVLMPGDIFSALS